MRLIVLLLLGCGMETPWGDADWTSRHGLRVVENGYPVNRLDVEDLTEDVLVEWNDDCARRSIRDWFLAFVELPFYDRPYFGDLALRGATYPALHAMVVGFESPLPAGTIHHELDHVVAGRCFGDWNYGHEDLGESAAIAEPF